MVELKDIKKSYQDGENRLNHVLCSLDMQVDKGEFVAVQGVSGSGKTTLLSVLGTLLPPDSGSYLLDGVGMITEGDHSETRNQKIGFVFQDHRLMPQYTALENILLPVLAGQPRVGKEQTGYALRLMELARIPDVGNQYPHTLSGGEASRVAVCRALIMKPLLLLADEPTGQLDPENARNIVSILSEINKTLHTTIIMVTHSDETSAAAHRILTLKDGILQ